MPRPKGGRAFTASNGGCAAPCRSSVGKTFASSREAIWYCRSILLRKQIEEPEYGHWIGVRHGRHHHPAARGDVVSCAARIRARRRVHAGALLESKRSRLLSVDSSGAADGAHRS